MKSQKGITLISLIVYVIVMLIVMSIIGTITSYFYSNVKEQYEESKNESTDTYLDMYLTNDLKNEKIVVKTATGADMPSTGSKNIKLSYENNEEVIYTITNNGIYRDKVKIYSNQECSNMLFVLRDVQTSSVIKEKQKLLLQNSSEILKEYTINIESKAVYD